jgi:hypothetical protein
MSARSSDKETDQVNRQARSVAGLASALLIAGLVLAACGRGGTRQEPQPAATVQPAGPSSVTASLVPDMPGASSPYAMTEATPTATPASPVPANTSAPDATTDPVVGEIQSIDGTLQGIDGSLSGADAGTNGGE